MEAQKMLPRSHRHREGLVSSERPRSSRADHDTTAALLMLLLIALPAWAVMPTYVGAGAVAESTSAITVALPSSLATNDVLLLFLETANQVIGVANPNGGTWVELPDSPQGLGTIGATSGGRLTVFWSRYNGTQGNPTTTDSGEHQAGRMLAFRGVSTSGNPWDVTSGGTAAVPLAPFAVTGDTTTVQDCLIIIAVACNTPDDLVSAVNSNLANLTTRTEDDATAGNGGWLVTITGEKSAAGVYGDTTLTVADAGSNYLFVTIALRPDAASPGAQEALMPVLQ